MRRLTAILATSGVIGTVLLAVLLWLLAASPWLLWHLLPAGSDLRVVSRLDHPAAHALLHTTSAVPGNLDPAAVTSLGLARTGTSTTLVVVPRLTTYRSVYSTLVNAGWQVEWAGRILRATTEAVNAPALTTALPPAAQTLLSFQLPAHPVIIAETAASAAQARTPAAVIVTRHQRGLLINAGPSLTDLGREVNELIAQPHNEIKGLQIALPSDKLALIPREFAARMSQQVSAQLQLPVSSGEFLQALTAHAHSSLVLAGDAAAVAVSPASDAFRTTITDWLEGAERAQRPITRQFRLPDGTLGEEVVPGERQPVLAPAVNNCHAPLPGKAVAWVCQTERATTVATSQNVAEQTDRLLNNFWVIRLDAASLADLCAGTSADPIRAAWCSLKSLTLIGSDPHHATGLIELK